MSFTASRRRFFSPWPFALAAASVALAVGVFTVTQEVKRREAHVAELNRQILSEQQTLRVLDAEWAYLTRPQRLEDLMALRIGEMNTEDKADSAEAVDAKEEEVVTKDAVPTTPQTVTQAKPAAKPETKKIAATEPAAGVHRPVATSAVKKTVSAKPASIKSVSSKTKSADMVWPIARKHQKTPADASKKRAAPAGIQQISYPPRAGVARPIVE